MRRFMRPLKTRTAAMIGAAAGMPQALAFLPAITLASFWLGGELALLVTALAFPPLLLGAGALTPRRGRPAADAATGLALRETVIEALDNTLADPDGTGLATAAIAISLEGVDELAERFGTPVADMAVRRVAERLAGALRGTDTLGRLGGTAFGVALAPMRRADLETLLQISGRLQDAVREPISIDATTAYVSSSVGFCLPSRSPAPTGGALLAAAETAMREARAHGPGAIRAFSSEMRAAIQVRHTLIDELAGALEAGDIRAWFQPQISTDTGAVTGFEALARWPHRERGMIPPAEFLKSVEQAGLAERLTEEMLFHAFSALRSWDKAGIEVPAVGVNFSGEELRNARLVDKIRWELDRFGLAPGRLTVEVLETVISESGEDMIARNIAGLSELGCGIDLDDFGTGHAAIASIRRFAVRRLKIDRSFVTRVDQDRDQQNMVAAILTMAERLNLETVAEGVETVGEHAMLAQLGCDHVQGFGIARPMPFDETIAWVKKHREKLRQTPSLNHRAG